ncbi:MULTISPECIES: hypothetical protein [unclassified Endozoicomonas]|uniref:hypothetical protein n=1 Tax=unclassified Endozoicomonas TaxID=2644528 RepID=UPI002148A78F|nr:MULTISPECIES: hypothetical protein [unclassified Endozoicomonas]
MDRLMLLVLVLTNALLLFQCLSRKPAVELSLPFIDGQVGIQSGGASRVYHRTLTPRNLSPTNCRRFVAATFGESHYS